MSAGSIVMDPVGALEASKATITRKRGNSGELGVGTAGSRLKSAWRKRLSAASTAPVSLLSFVRSVAKLKNEDAELAEDAKLWLSTKKKAGR